MRIRALSCFVGCCLFCFSVFAETPSEPSSSGLSSIEATATVAGSSADAQPQGTTNAPSCGSPCGTPSGRAKPSATAAAATTPYVFPTGAEMNHYWLTHTIGPKAFMGATFTASWNQWIADSPSEWAKDATGWGQRFGSALLDNGINTTSLVWISRATGQDPGYRRCDCTGFGPRLGHTFKLAFFSYNRNGGLSFSPAKIISPVTGPLVTRNTIYPDRFSGAGDAFGGYAYYFAGSVAWNVFKEFFWNLR